MILKMIQSVLCVFLFVSQGVEGNVKEKVIKGSESVNIDCEKDLGTLFWLRQKGNGGGFEYVGTYSRSKNAGKAVDANKFKVTEKSLTVNNFEPQKDSGVYSCVFINNNELQFSGVTKLSGEPVPTVKPKVQTVPVQTVAVTTSPVPTCGQNAKGSTAGKQPETLDVLLGCELHIFISLVAGCGILLLLLLLTILYCNHIRTRRCPHHYKRQPRCRAAGHKTLPNPPDY